MASLVERLRERGEKEAADLLDEADAMLLLSWRNVDGECEFCVGGEGDSDHDDDCMYAAWMESIR